MFLVSSIRKLCLLSAFVASISTSAQLPRSESFHNQYKLVKVVVVGRHHVRSAAISKGERRITPHQWHKWNVADGNLTERGAALEKQMGIFFSQWIAGEHLLNLSTPSSADSVYLYANSMPRTIETGQNFAEGFMPSTHLAVNYNSKSMGSMDSVFFDMDFKISDTFKSKAKAELEYGCGEGGFAEAIRHLKDDAATLAEVLDISKAPSCTQGDTCSFHFENPSLYLHYKWMPRISGGNIYLAQLAASNLILQYYDMPESEGSIFGHAITDEQLCAIGRVKDMWCHLSMGFPSVGRDICHNLLREIRKDMADSNKKFIYLIGHDSNMAGLTGALEVKEYNLEGTPECKTPLGGKIVFEIWEDSSGEAYVGLNYVYQNIRQIMKTESLNIENPPMVTMLEIEGLRNNSEGLYKLEDFSNHLDKAISEFDALDDYFPSDVNLDRKIDMLDAVDILMKTTGMPYKFFVPSQADIDGNGTINADDAVRLMEIIANTSK